MTNDPESLEFEWVNHSDSETDTVGVLRYLDDTGEPYSMSRRLRCATSELSGETLKGGPTIDNLESVDDSYSKWGFEINYVKLGDPPRVCFPEEGEWVNVLGLYQLSYPLLSTCNRLIALDQHVPWDDSELHQWNGISVPELNDAYSVLWAGVSSVFTRLYDRDWHRLGAFSHNDSLGSQRSNELDRRVWQLTMNTGRRIGFEDGVYVLLAVFFDERQYVKLTLVWTDGQMCERWVENSKLITSTPGFYLPDDCYGTFKQSVVAEPIERERGWVFPPQNQRVREPTVA